MYRLKLNVSACTVHNIVIEDHDPRPKEFWGSKLNQLIEGDFLEEVGKEKEVEADTTQEPEKKEGKKDRKRGQ
jgi:hypothetical protein